MRVEEQRITPVFLGFCLALAVLLADQASKLGVLWLYDIRLNGPTRFTPFFDIVEYWNRGISFSLLRQDSDLGRWLLFALKIGAAIGFSVWLWRGVSRTVAVSLGLLIGGALGNAIDRAAHGAVFDFLVMHVGPFTWPTIFNIADAAIVAGVLVMLYDSLLSRHEPPAAQGS